MLFSDMGNSLIGLQFQNGVKLHRDNDSQEVAESQMFSFWHCRLSRLRKSKRFHTITLICQRVIVEAFATCHLHVLSHNPSEGTKQAVLFNNRCNAQD